jgi:CheY-like chemotaxis protein
MPDGGRLTLETRPLSDRERPPWVPADIRGGPYACLLVSDTGVGMDQRILQRIFEPFFTTKGVGKGTGLGLSMVYGIVKQSNGHIGVQSQPGSGTSVAICFPQLKDAVTESEIAPGETEVVGGSETILLVEDEAEVRELSASILRGLGYTVVEARNGREALRVITSREGEVHLLVTDVVMAGIGGIALAAQAREMCPSLRVLFVSGYTDDPALAKVMTESGAGFLQKPASPDQLARKVREVLAAGSGAEGLGLPT